MAKKQSFADKASKKSLSEFCPVCKSELSHILVVQAKKRNGNWRFSNGPVGVCKCNEAEVYG